MSRTIFQNLRPWCLRPHPLEASITQKKPLTGTGRQRMTYSLQHPVKIK
jgi:hypothetical protein